MQTCPACGAAVSPREAGCPTCGQIFDVGERAIPARPLDPLPVVEDGGEVERARSGGTGWRSCLIAGCGCLLVVAAGGALFMWVAGRGMGRMIDDTLRVQQEASLIALRRALEDYADEHGDLYPHSLELLTEREGGGPWIESLPSDRWGRRFEFEPPAELARGNGSGRLFSFGRDGKPGGEGPDADVDEPAAGLKPSPR